MRAPGTIFKTCMVLGCAAVHTRACIGAIGVITELSPRLAGVCVVLKTEGSLIGGVRDV